MHIHGTADRNVPIGGGRGPDAISAVSFNPPLAGVDQIAAADGCETPPPPEATDPANAAVHVQTWTGCAPGTAVEFVKVDGASHAWMGSSGASPLSGPAYQGLDSTAVIWAFLQAHPRA